MLRSARQEKKPGTTTKMLRSNSLPCEKQGEKDRKQEKQEKIGRSQGSGRRAGVPLLFIKAGRCSTTQLNFVRQKALFCSTLGKRKISSNSFLMGKNLGHALKVKLF